jgi:hypothetical protein
VDDHAPDLASSLCDITLSQRPDVGQVLRAGRADGCGTGHEEQRRQEYARSGWKCVIELRHAASIL